MASWVISQIPADRITLIFWMQTTIGGFIYAAVLLYETIL
jgi:hypothetical protein